MEQLQQALTTVAVGIVTAIGALIVPAIPQVWRWLGARIHGENVLLLRQTIENRAALAVKATREQGVPVEEAIDHMVVQVRDISLPRTVKKLKLNDEELRQMCVAAFYRVSNGLPAP